jgi:hypothetical protein
MLPVNITPLCELASQMHDHDPSSLSRCAKVAPDLDKPQESSPITTTPGSSSTPVSVELQNNFASKEKGALIISEFTSPTHTLPPLTTFPWLILHFTGYMIHRLGVRRPRILLDEHVVDGDCWEFSAIDGRVGIQLAERITISHISLNYIPAGQLSPYAATKVPQDISIWGLIQDTIALRIIPEEIPVLKADYFLQKGSRLPLFVNSSSHFIQLARFRYDASSTPWQQFSVSQSAAQVSDTQTIIAAFETNKGANTTCIYTIGIHGVPASL